MQPYENYPTMQMVEEAGEQQLVLWLSLLKEPETAEQCEIVSRVIERMLEFA
jgi:hypothetical protein